MKEVNRRRDGWMDGKTFHGPLAVGSARTVL